MNQDPPLGKDELQIVGRMLVKEDPASAKRLLTKYNAIVEEEKTGETDLSRIPFYFDRFRAVMKMTGENLTGETGKRNINDIQRTFLAVLLRIYCPQVFKIKLKGSKVIPHGFGLKAAEVLKRDRNNTRLFMKIALSNYEVYDHFRELVDKTAGEILKNATAKKANNL